MVKHLRLPPPQSSQIKNHQNENLTFNEQAQKTHKKYSYHQRHVPNQCPSSFAPLNNSVKSKNNNTSKVCLKISYFNILIFLLPNEHR